MPQELIEVPIEDLVVLQSQVRTRDIMNGIDELASSMNRLGLLEPIIVARTDQPGKYQIVAGQRRVLAARRLNWKTIMAVVYHLKKTDDIEAKIQALSLTENVVRIDLKRQDLIDACESLFMKYGSIKSVVEETGLPHHVVRQYVRVARLYTDLKPLVTQQGLDVDLVLDAQDIATNPETGGVDIERAKRIAIALKPLDNAARRVAKEFAEKNPNASIEQMVSKAKEPPRIERVSIQFDRTSFSALKKYAADNESEGSSIADVVQQIVTDVLSKQGYLGNE